MAVNCNRVVNFDETTLARKSSLGRSASIALHAALSNCYKAIEMIEASPEASGGEIVYFRATTDKLETAAQALDGMRDILAQGKLSETAIAWIKALDYDRLYSVGTTNGLIPRFREQWDRLVRMMQSLNHLAVTECLISDVKGVQREIKTTIDALIPGKSGASTASDQAERLATVQTNLVQLAIFAQMVSYLNNLEPLDLTWCRDVIVGDLGHVANNMEMSIQ